MFWEFILFILSKILRSYWRGAVHTDSEIRHRLYRTTQKSKHTLYRLVMKWYSLYRFVLWLRRDDNIPRTNNFDTPCKSFFKNTNKKRWVKCQYDEMSKTVWRWVELKWDRSQPWFASNFHYFSFSSHSHFVFYSVVNMCAWGTVLLCAKKVDFK